MGHTLEFIANHLFNVVTWLVLASWACAGMGAAIHYVFQHQAPDKSLRGFIRFVLPAELWQHPSCRRDYVYAAISRMIEPFTIGLLLVSAGAISSQTYGLASALFGPPGDPQFSWAVWIVMVLIALTIQDFLTWYSHYLEHKLPILWELHKVHHSAEFLNPLSNRRHHPIQLVWEVGLSNVGAGAVLGIVSYVMGVPVLDNICLGADAYFVGNALSFHQLRHSHIPLRYGRWEKWLLSPAQHILHHSAEMEDWDVNFGLLTSVWDRLFKTIKYSVPGHRFRLGLQPQQQREYDSVLKLYTTPVVNLAKMAWQPLARGGAATVLTVEEAVVEQKLT